MSSEAVEAAALGAVIGAVIWGDDTNRPELRDIARDIAQAVITAVEPILRGDERAKVAEELRAEAERRYVADDPFALDMALAARWLTNRNAAIARQHAAKAAETAVGATEAPAESGRTPRPAETRSGHATQEADR